MRPPGLPLPLLPPDFNIFILENPVKSLQMQSNDSLFVSVVARGSYLPGQKQGKLWVHLLPRYGDKQPHKLQAEPRCTSCLQPPKGQSRGAINPVPGWVQ